ncbi:MAG: cell division protein FtsA [Prolixibacteraceae bacterium]|jgi:cell division protein FtsA|nr:cell division protein FtsA [Prolixibacteraceae bacterium]
MSERNIFAAVDIGTNTIICLLGSDSGEHKIEIVGHAIVASSGVRRGVIINVEEVAQAIKKAVDKARGELNIAVKKLYVNVAGHQLHTVERKLTKQIEVGKIISKADVRQLFDEARQTPLNEGEKIYHVINQSYCVDGEIGINNPIGITGTELLAQYRLIVGPENYEKVLKTSVERAGFEMVKCVANPVAAAEAVLTDDEKEAGVVVVDLGGGTTSISIYHDNVFRHLGMVPFGGNVVTNDIREGCSILLRQAESLKVQYGAAMGEHVPDNRVVTIPGINGWEPKEISFKSLAYIIQARMEEIIESVYYQVEKSGYADKLGAGIVVTGGGAKLRGIRQLVLFKTGLNVRDGKPVNGIIDESEKAIDNPQFATAFGLLKKAVRDENAQNDELINKKSKPKKLRTNYSEAFMQKLSLFFNDENDAEF